VNANPVVKSTLIHKFLFWKYKCVWY